ncbi:hypothetical protein HHL22_06755 [Hymenobacter sp. RP-2-7]|uniref:DUF7033 domain-containing protein n=1 Tax=Hymenobacter polaris TaxID=2682546 RepID=A0A7Y0FLK6_9BACT|nr:hypothetical protein [Hymenobacter polaris]NML64903.1 hypothetical protein [Hymenobacter polaris]
MTTPPLPAPAAPVSAMVRLGYVRRQLARAYPGLPTELLGYADGGQPVVVVAEGSAGFFDGTQPYPPAPTWREWRGRRVPFFFDAPLGEPLLTERGGQVFVAADVVAAAFYLLSGWQEYFSDERDQHGRFPYAASVQQQYGFAALPVVNYYFDVLKTALEQATGQQYAPRRWGPQRAEFAAFISHDVDNLRSAWKAPAKAALGRGQLLRFGRLLWRHLTQPDAWDNLEAVAAQVAQYGGRSTFFILPEHRRAPNGTPNADYQFTPQFRHRLRRLQEQGCELGLHGSLGTSIDNWALIGELRRLYLPGSGLRFHYLHWEPYRTPTMVEWTEVIYDSTLGFAEHYGFRHSYCLPFYPFDFATGSEASFLEIPLNVMDATLHHPRYLQLAPSEILPALAPIFAEIRRFGGVASVLWHNENFDPTNERNGPREFHALMRHLQDLGAAFRTGREIYSEFVAPPGSSR